MESRTIDLGGPVHLADFGGSGMPLVCVHGLGGSHLNWMAAAPCLAQRYRVLAPDLIGHGLTVPHGRSASVDSNRLMLHRLLTEHIREPVVLAGNSLGGLISMLEAAANPGQVRGLVLVNPAAPLPSLVPTDKRTFLFFAALTLPGVGERFLSDRAAKVPPEKQVDWMLQLCCADPAQVPAHVVDRHYELARSHSQAPWGHPAMLEATRSMIWLLAARRRFDAAVHQVRAPTLLIGGHHDRLVDLGALERLSKMRPDWHFAPLDHCGHVPQLEDAPGFCGRVTSWIEGSLLSSAGTPPARA